QRGRLSRAVGAEEPADLTARHREGQVVDGAHLAVVLADAVDLDDRVARGSVARLGHAHNGRTESAGAKRAARADGEKPSTASTWLGRATTKTVDGAAAVPYTFSAIG